jgi:hypothetical protein
MKRYFLVICLLLCGCTTPSIPVKSGTIVLQKFTVDGYTSADPTSMKNDVAEWIQELLQKNITSSIYEDTPLTVVESCELADYLLTGHISRINTIENRIYRGFVLFSTDRYFEVQINGNLTRCKTEEQIAEIKTKIVDEKIDGLMAHAAHDITNGIKRGLGK